MATYKIIHKEELIGWFYVEADSEKEAMDVWDSKVNNGEIDFSDLEMTDSSDYAVYEGE